MRKLMVVGLAMSAVLATVSAGPAATPSNARAGLIRSCQTQMYMSAAACSCLADKAEVQLDATAIAYLSLQALDVTHSAAMAKAMSGAERNKIDSFMRTVPDQCQAAK
jgi:hypothetical protein